ncbi:MAG: hypothetical protein C5B57_08670 [Blastocatellia bacterium]|nr:MAG: hypothetical protein C5B57_08670 [Blastocatellia bacterium]
MNVALESGAHESAPDLEGVMASTARWLGWTTIVLVLHMSEQLAFGLTELKSLKYMINSYDRWFASPDTATVVLVTVTAALVYVAMFSLLKGGIARLVALELVGVLSVSEVHHIVETIAARGYTAGAVTSVPYMACGVLLMSAAAREYGLEYRPRV